jgi:predicted phage tail protein
MFCPKCGSNQGEGKRFCTICGTNLAAVSQALSGRLPQPNYYAPPVPHPLEIERQRAMAKGVRLTIIGGGFVAWQFFNFVFSSHFSGSPIGFWAFIGFILLAGGISKIIASRPPSAANLPAPAPAPHQAHSMQQGAPHPVFSAPAAVGPAVPQTSELGPAGLHAPSVTEDDTRHLPQGEPPRELSR